MKDCQVIAEKKMTILDFFIWCLYVALHLLFIPHLHVITSNLGNIFTHCNRVLISSLTVSIVFLVIDVFLLAFSIRHRKDIVLYNQNTILLRHGRKNYTFDKTDIKSIYFDINRVLHINSDAGCFSINCADMHFDKNVLTKFKEDYSWFYDSSAEYKSKKNHIISLLIGIIIAIVIIILQNFL